MKRRSFLLASGSAILSGTAISGIQRPAFGLDFELLTTPSTDPRNLDSVLVDFDSFRLTPQYVDSSEDATITIDISLGNYSHSVSKTVSVANGQVITTGDLEPEIPISVDNIDTAKSSIDGEIVIKVEHSSIGTETYNQIFTITDNPLVNGLIAYYPMEKGAGHVLHDATSNNNDGQIDGATWNGTGQVGSDSLSFDGTDDYVALRNDFGFGDGNWTITAWAKFDSSQLDKETVVSNYSGANELYNIYVDNNSRPPVLSGEIRDPSGNYASAVGSTDVGDEWYHLSLIRRSPNLEIYVNGNSDGSTDVSSVGSVDNVAPFIGARASDNKHFPGPIDDVRVYDRALSPNEIEDLYNLTEPSGYEVTESYVPSQGDGGISRYKFNGDVTDSWGSNDGTDNTSAGFVDGVYGQAKDFDGTDDYVSVPPSWSFDVSTPFTVSAWVLPDSLSSDMNIAGQRESADNFWHLQTDGSARASMWVRGNSTGAEARGGSLSTGEWTHILGVYNGSGKTKAYIDGDIVGTATASMSGDIDAFEASLGIGARDVDSTRKEYLDGSVEDVRIYDRALSESEIEDLFSLGSYRL